jgi:hypothetical protein
MMLYLQTNIPTARQLKKLIADSSQDSVSTLTNAATVTQSSVVCQLVSAISTGSTTPVKANIMRLAGNSWETTGQQIEVRSATGAAVTTTGRHIARKVGSFGYCVVQT